MSANTLAAETLEAPLAGADPAALATEAGGETIGGRVLLVEDDAPCARLLAANLTAVGHSVEIVKTAEDAQRSLVEAKWDLVLIDVFLPEMDGLELTRWIRAQSINADVPILVITSLDDRKVLARSLDAGADDFLIKPVDAPELRMRARLLLRDKGLAAQLRAREEALRPALETALEAAPDKLLDLAPAKPASDRQPQILIVDGDVEQTQLLETDLQGLAPNLRTVREVQAALDTLEQENIDLVLLDLVLADGSGYTVIEQMRASRRHAQTPILMVSACADVQDRVRALEVGADDFIVKGSDRAELEARVRRLLRTKRSLDQLTRRCDHALRLAVTDSLTGLFTHGFLCDTLQRQAASAQREGWPLALLFIDIDHFKAINDRHGHAMGDEVLRQLSSVIRNSVREGDICVRYGGEEFVVVLPHTARATSTIVAERIRLAIEAMLVRGPKMNRLDGLRLTVSIGVAGLPEDARDARALLEHADDAMYQAKRDGRNQVIVFSETTAPTQTRNRVLLVDDDARNLRLLEACLQAEGYELIKAQDGAEALEIARRESPDLILMDGMMPRMSGFEACHKLKQDNATCLIPIVMVTALNSREDKLRGIEAGADDFLTKPIDRVALLTRVRALLRAKHSTDSFEDAEAVIFMLAKAVESRDPSTGGHIERVSHYAVALGQALGLPPSTIDALRRGGVVHDIGKITVPDAILLKPGKLTAEERAQMQTHVEIGYEMLRPMRTFRECLPAVRFHHERLDGSGYPLGLRGDQIPLLAQIMAVVDVFDALTTDRVYRAAFTHAEALEILRTEAAQGLHCPKLVETFVATLKSAAAVS